MSLFSSIGNFIGGAFGAVMSPISDLMGMGQISSMLNEMNQSSQELMSMSSGEMGQMQSLLNQAVANANSYTSALGQGRQQIPMPNGILPAQQPSSGTPLRQISPDLQSGGLYVMPEGNYVT